MSHHDRPPAGCNVAVVRGRLSSDPVHRQLPSGDRLIGYEVTVPTPSGPAESVPVVWIVTGRPPAVTAGDEVVVVGRVRRRFFRAAGTTASRTEVVATRVVPTRLRARARAAVAAAVDEIGSA
jgi:single-strand DNA-binding protein